MRENKVLAPKQNLNNNRQKGTKITVSKSCQLVDLQKVLIENKLARLLHKLSMDRWGQFPFIWNGADYLLQNPLSFHILMKSLFGKRQIQPGKDRSFHRRQYVPDNRYTLKNNQGIFHTIIIFFSFNCLFKNYQLLDFDRQQGKTNTLDENAINKEDR